jgi:hypothetical protein
MCLKVVSFVLIRKGRKEGGREGRGKEEGNVMLRLVIKLY